MTDRHIPSGVLADAAFALWTSSTVSRFARSARRAAATSPLAQRVRFEPDLVPVIVQRCEALVDLVSGSAVRSEDEVELVVLLATIEKTASPMTSRLLQAIALNDSPAMMWVAALARDALRRLDANVSVRSGFAKVIHERKTSLDVAPRASETWSEAS